MRVFGFSRKSFSWLVGWICFEFFGDFVSHFVWGRGFFWILSFFWGCFFILREGLIFVGGILVYVFIIEVDIEVVRLFFRFGGVVFLLGFFL